ncbi:MAG: hypothetical protein M0027_09905 [Candidatus Dormibacteraeota bacterium]|jgi:hypothetical protein|nr:hypothetical protein [Candidatus Dormibacteraeota bacterium]
MAWPVEAMLLLLALAGCWAAAAAIQAALSSRSLPLLVSGLAIIGSLLAEVATLNGNLGGSLGSGVGVPVIILAGIALGALALYLLLPPPEPAPPAPPQRTGPAANPDSEA